ncbi:MAG: hypothetical protein EXS05_11640 [Planctomycetaceae bacterium]|nr:hypothetical protein [Planctomycetaceae bacterium]
MNDERKKSNQIAWIWFIAASGLLIITVILLPLAFFGSGIREKFGDSRATALLLLFAAMAFWIIMSMLRRAKSFEEDDPQPVSNSDTTADSVERKRQSELVWIVVGCGVVIAAVFLLAVAGPVLLFFFRFILPRI